MGPNPTEPANYRGSNTRGSKEIVGIETAMYENARTVTRDTITIAPRIIVTIAAMQLFLLLKPKVSAHEEGGTRN